MRIKSGLFFIALGISLTANSLTLTQAKKLYTEGRFEEALSTFQDLQKKNPQNANYNQWLGGCLYETGKKEEAIPYLETALSKKVADGELIVVEKLEVSAPKTKEMVRFAEALKLDKRTVLVMDTDDANVILASRNIQNLSTLPVAQISTYEVVANRKVVLTKGAVEKIQEVYGA